MKPTEKQIRIAEIIKGQASFWQKTNDINSPTHFGDISEDLLKINMDNVLDKDKSKEFQELLDRLYIFVRSLER